MDTKLPDDAALQKAVRLGHETRDVSVRALFTVAGSLLMTLVVVLAFIAWVFREFEHVDKRLNVRSARTEPGARSLVAKAPDYEGPLLQVQPEEDLRWLKKHTVQDLDSYGWIDRKAGVVRIPIDRAIDLIVAGGLPPVSPGLTMEALQRQRAQPEVWGQALRP